MSHLLKLLPLPVFPGVQPLTIRGVDWLRRGRPEIRDILGDRKASRELVKFSHKAMTLFFDFILKLHK